MSPGSDASATRRIDIIRSISRITKGIGSDHAAIFGMFHQSVVTCCFGARYIPLAAIPNGCWQIRLLIHLLIHLEPLLHSTAIPAIQRHLSAEESTANQPLPTITDQSLVNISTHRPRSRHQHFSTSSIIIGTENGKELTHPGRDGWRPRHLAVASDTITKEKKKKKEPTEWHQKKKQNRKKKRWHDPCSKFHGPQTRGSVSRID